MARPSQPSFVTTIPQVVTPDQTITFRAACVSNPTATLNVYLQPNGPDPMPIWSEMDILPDDPWGGVPTYWVEIPLADTSVTPGEWQIAIGGHNADGYSTGQAVQVITVAERPVVTITSPADGVTITELPLIITWEVTDATGVSSQTVGVGARSAPEYTVDVPSSQRSVTLTASDIGFADGGSYPIWVDVSNGVGLSSSAQVNVNVNWIAPATPTVRYGRIYDDLSVLITVFEGDGDEPETTSLMVTRINADGTRWVVASDLRSGNSCVDPLPPLNVEYSYEATAIAASGATARTTVTTVLSTRNWALNFGASAGEVMTLVGNPKASYSLDQGGAAYHFAGGAGGLPVWYGTTDRDESGTLSFDTMLWHDSDRLRELCRQYPVAWLRDPFGHRWRAHVQPKISHGIGDTWQISINWDAVRFEEAW